MNIEVVVSQALFVEQEVESNIKGLTLEDRLAFTEAANSNLHSRQLSSFLLVRQLALAGVDFELEVEDTLTLSQDAHPRAFVLTVSQVCFVWDAAINEGFWPQVSQALALDQTVDVEVAKGALDTLTIEQTIDLNITRNLTIEQTFLPTQGAIGFLPDKYWHSFEIEVVEP
jgi:hypothetical protein